VSADLQYAVSADGVRIAFAVTGEGPPLVHMPNVGASMLELERQIPEREAWNRLLARRFTLVRYDARGVGFSQRDVADVSVEAHLLDLNAVVAALNLRSFVLFGFLWSAYVAPYYAAERPELVSRLVLWPPDIRSLTSDEYQSLGRLAATDWHTFTETYAHLALGWEEGEAAHRYAAILRESVSSDTLLREMADSQVSMSHLMRRAPAVRVPTLVLQRKMRFAGERVARLAAALPDARLRILDGDTTVPYLGDAAAVVDAIVEFATPPDGRSRAGEAPMSPVGTAAARGDQEMTSRELDVLRLLAQGRSNQEIADELVLSVRTVERHLSNIYSKLGASGKSARAAAAAYAANRSLTGAP